MNKYLAKIEKKLSNNDWYRVAFLGDSITSAEWVHPNWRSIIEYVLKDKLQAIMGEWEKPCWKIRSYNAGFNGATTKEIIDYIDEEIAQYKPDLVIFMDTYNDKYRDIDARKHADNLDLIFTKLLNLSKNVVFTSSIARLKAEANLVNKKYMDSARETIQKYSDKIQFVDVFSKYAELDLKKIFTFIEYDGNEDSGIEPGGLDFSHPNQLGNAYIAKIMLKEIFDIDFNPELYISETLAGKKYPLY